MSVLESPGVADPYGFVTMMARATVLLLLTALAIFVLRRAAAATRHGVLALAAGALLALPLLRVALPRIDLAVLPAPAAAPTQPTFVFEARPASTPAPASPSRARVVPSAEGPSGPASPAPLRVPTTAPWPLSRWVVVLWAAGVAFGLAQLVLASLLVRRTARAGAPLEDPAWDAHARETASHLGLSRPVRLLSSPAAAVPVVFGYRRGVVLLPTDAGDWPEDRRRAFLLHELAHVHRHDCLTQTIGHLARIVYWPNPLAWWLVGRLRAEAERASDDRVLASGTSGSDYAAHLLQAARELKRAARPLAVLAVVERSRLEDRLLALLDPGIRRGPFSRRSLGWGAAATVLCAAAIAPLQPAGRAAARPGREAKAAVRTNRLATVSVPVVQAALRASNGEDERPSPGPTPGSGVPVVPAPPVAADAEETPATELFRESGQEVDVDPPPLAPAATPSPRVPVIRISTELVQIDAVVTDKAGQPVTDLQAGDFELFESGRRQKVSHLAYVKTGQGPTSGEAPPLAAHELSAPRTLVFFVDDFGLSLHSVDRLRRGLLAFADKNLQAADRVAIIKASDRAQVVDLSAGADTFRASARELKMNLWSRESPQLLGTGADERNWRARLAIDSVSALKNVIDALRPLQGRKAVIFLSEGFPNLTSQDDDRLLRLYTERPLDGLYGDYGMYAAIRSLIDLANRASVVIYTLDPAGLGSRLADASQLATSSSTPAPLGTIGVVSAAADSRGDPTGGDAPAVSARHRLAIEHFDREGSLLELAQDTGGLAIQNRNDVLEGLGRIMADHAGYYLIGYEPDAATFASKSGSVEFHEVGVRVKRPGLKVRSRKGFYGVPDETVAQVSPPR